MIPLSWVLGLSFVLFGLGAVGFLVKKDMLSQFLSLEVMLNAVALAFVGFAAAARDLSGQVIVFFIITVAAAEAALGLSIILLVFRRRKTVWSDELRQMKE
jgi:NADH-quinone oxidoreductase subunit K